MGARGAPNPSWRRICPSGLHVTYLLHANYMLLAHLSPVLPPAATHPSQDAPPPSLVQPLTCLGGLPAGSSIPRGGQGRAGRQEEEDEVAQTGAIAFTHLRGAADGSGPPRRGGGRGYQRMGGARGEGAWSICVAPAPSIGNRGVAPSRPHPPSDHALSDGRGALSRRSLERPWARYRRTAAPGRLAAPGPRPSRCPRGGVRARGSPRPCAASPAGRAPRRDAQGRRPPCWAIPGGGGRK